MKKHVAMMVITGMLRIMDRLQTRVLLSVLGPTSEHSAILNQM